MKLKTQIVIGAIFLASLPVALAVTLIVTHASSAARESAAALAKERLVASRNNTAERIENYFQFIEGQMITLAHSEITTQAMALLVEGFNSYNVESDSQQNAQAKSEAVADYYYTSFNDMYRKANSSSPLDIGQLLSDLGQTAVSLQYAYISQNPNPLGKKHLLDRSNDGTSYSEAHARFHPQYREFLEHFGYYDIFLVDAKTGNVVYSVFKELDFATSLKNGPYALSGLGIAFAEALKIKTKTEAAIADFAPYTPSYEAPQGLLPRPFLLRVQ